MKTKILVLLALAAAMAACGPTPAQIQAQNEKNPQYLYERAVVCMQYGIPDEAFKWLNQALALDPRHYLSYNLLGLAHMIKGNLPEAVKAFRSCISCAPSNFSEVYNNLGTALQESNQAGDAEAAFRKAFEIDQNYNASYNLGKIYYEQGKLDPALDAVRSSLQKYDRSLLAWNLERRSRAGARCNGSGPGPEPPRVDRGSSQAHRGPPEEDRREEMTRTADQVPSCHSAKYLFCSGVRRSIRMPIVWSFMRAMSLSIASGTG